MNEAQITHARRALACPRWRWMAGMLAYFEHDGRRVCVGMPDAWASTTALPDLTDPATVGCLLELVRRAHAHPDHLWGGRVEVHQDHRDIFVVVRPDHDPRSGALFHRCIATGTTEVEALVAALEAAP